MKIKNKLKKILLFCSLFVMVFCMSVPVMAAYKGRTNDGCEIPDLPTIPDGYEYVIFYREFKMLYIYIYPSKYNIGMWDNVTPYQTYKGTGNNAISYYFPSETIVYSTTKSNGVFPAWTKVSNPSLNGTATPPSIYILFSSKDIKHTKDATMVFFSANTTFNESIQPSEPGSSEPEPSVTEEPSEEPSVPEEPSENPSEDPSVPEEPSEEPSVPDEPSEPEEPSSSVIPTVPIKPPKPVVTDNFLISFGNFIRGFFNSILDFKVALVCFGCILFIGVIGLVYSIFNKRF